MVVTQKCNDPAPPHVFPILACKRGGRNCRILWSIQTETLMFKVNVCGIALPWCVVPIITYQHLIPVENVSLLSLDVKLIYCLLLASQLGHLCLRYSTLLGLMLEHVYISISILTLFLAVVCRLESEVRWLLRVVRSCFEVLTRVC